MRKSSSKVTCSKTYRLPPELVEDMDIVVSISPSQDMPKYTSATDLVIKSLQATIREERKILEAEGVIWETLKSQERNNGKQKSKL